MKIRRQNIALVCGLGAIALSLHAHGGVSAVVGLDDLIARLGAGNEPTGAGVVASQVEAPEGANGYGPNQEDPEFTDVTFTAMSGSSGNSGHATLVAQNYYGSDTSIAPDLNTIFLYEANSWATTGYLRTGQGAAFPPFATPGGIRVFNNSWGGTFGSTTNDNDCLRRADFVVDRDELLICNGVNNAGGGSQLILMAMMFNSVSVGLENGNHISGPTPAGIDGPGRMKPEIVAPGQFTSFATPIVSAVGALLFETSNAWPGLSGNANALRSETIKATLLVGGNHRLTWSNGAPTSGPTRGQTSTPLDAVFGVDLVNVNSSHLALTGLEQAGSPTPPTAVNAQHIGWDLATIPTGGSQYYRFHVGSLADEVSIIATWHRIVATNFMSWSLANFNLVLWRLDSNGQLVTLVGDPGLAYFGGGNVVSQSSVDNVEHLFVTNLQPGDYVLEVDRVDGLAGNRDVAVAWLLPNTLEPGDVTGDGNVDINDLLAVVNAWGACPTPPLPCPADLTADGFVDVSDLLEVINNWG